MQRIVVLVQQRDVFAQPGDRQLLQSLAVRPFLKVLVVLIAEVFVAIGVLIIMWIAVSERTPEIGLLKALGAMPSDILLIFLGEATMLSCTGGAIGVAVGFGLGALIHVAFPGAPFAISLPYVAAALVTSVLVGLVCGVIPARRATCLDPIDALHAD